MKHAFLTIQKLAETMLIVLFYLLPNLYDPVSKCKANV